MDQDSVKPFCWNEDKNILLQTERGLGFEKIIESINQGQVLDIVDHPNQEKYPNQKMFILEIEQYVYVVPFVESEEKVFLKTIIPSRKMKKKYLGN